MEEELLSLRERMHLQTARISWTELERYFAGGRVILVNDRLDLVTVATTFVEDNTQKLQQWLKTQQVQVLPDDIAKQWVTTSPQNLWAVVVAPWVLVQDRLVSPHT